VGGAAEILLKINIGLSEDQEKWLESVRYGNLSSDQQWPPLTVNQSGYLALNVHQYTTITETANYPWSQAGERLRGSGRGGGEGEREREHTGERGEGSESVFTINLITISSGGVV
jgi:hypothetical protein